MSKNIDDYLFNRYKIHQISGSHAEEKKTISIELLGLSYDWIKRKEANKEKLDRRDLEDYLWSNTKITHKTLGLSSLFYWILLKILIRWIAEIVFERLDVKNG